jgi:urocanate hydratase
LALDPIESSAFDFILKVERLYAGLTATASADLNSEQGLGGELLYAGELDGRGRALLVAGNIAGVATLAATADGAAQKQAVKDGVADFLVTTLDEALRILKNQIRKRETAAVCVAATPEAIEREMLERGVLPDLLRPADDGECKTPSAFTKQGARAIVLPTPGKNSTLLIWQVDEAPALWLPKLDAIALGCLIEDEEHEDWAARRWLRLAPRYLGRLTKGTRVLRSEEENARKFAARVRDAVKSGEIGVQVRMNFGDLSGLAEPSPHSAVERAESS